MPQNLHNSDGQKLRSQFLSGVRWTGASQVLQQVLNLGSSVIMARLLAPEDFGLFAMACVFTGIVYSVLEMGLGAALIQRRDVSPLHISSVFWLNIAVGMLMTGIGIGCSWAIASFYQTPTIQPLVAMLSLNYCIYSLSSTQTALLRRQMQFQQLELRNLFGQFVGICSAIALAFWGFGVWSLVFRVLITTVTNTITLWSIANWRPTLQFSWKHLRELLGFSNDVLGTNLLLYIGQNTDNLLIGRFVGASALGYYNLSYRLMTLPVQSLNQVLSKVTFPVMSRLQEDRRKLQQLWFRATKVLSALIVPLMLGLMILAPELVQVVYGPKWLPAAPVLQILAIVGITKSLTGFSSTVLLCVGQSRLRLQLSFFSVTLAVISFIVGLPFGIQGVATGFAVANITATSYTIIKTLDCVNSNLGQYLANLMGIFIAAGVANLAVWALNTNLLLAPGLRLVICILLGSLLYLLLLRLLAASLWEEVLNLIPERIAKRWLKSSITP